MSDSVLVLLRDEFADNDLASKRRASERLDLVARALGPERARKELVPWLQANTTQEDEVLFVFAKKLGALVDLLGGAEHLDCLLPVVEALLEVDETYVREAAVESARKLVGAIRSEAVRDKAVELAVRLGKNEWFTARMSACSLAGALLKSGASGESVRVLKEMFFNMCKDETPMVRRAASLELGSVLPRLEAAEVVQEVVPMQQRLSTDPQESVALNWIAAACDVAERLGPEQACEHLMATVKQQAADRSWRVRLTIAQHLPRLAAAFGRKAAQESMLPVLCDLLRDPEGEVRAVASAKAEAVAALVGTELTVHGLLPVLARLVEADAQRALRLNLAASCVARPLLEVVGPAHAKEHLWPIWEHFLHDTSSQCAPECRLIVLGGLDNVAKLLGVAWVHAEWVPMLRELFQSSRHFSGASNDSLANPAVAGGGPGAGAEEIEHPQWRLRVAVLAALAKLVTTDGAPAPPEVEALTLELWSSALADEVFEVRIAAARAVTSFCDCRTAPGATKTLNVYVPKLVELFKASKGKFQHRIVFAHAFGTLIKAGNNLAVPLYPYFEKCLDDKVPNVRLCAVSVVTNASDEHFKAAFSKHLHALMDDQDPDVAARATLCVESLY